MNTLMQGFLDNDSFFGRFMTKLGIIIAANIMFVLLSIPFFTIGAGLSALYYVMFGRQRSPGSYSSCCSFSCWQISESAMQQEAHWTS